MNDDPHAEKASFEDLAAQLDKAGRIAVAAHARPDGDAIGSSVALGESLAEAGKEVAVLNQDPVPEILRGVPGWERIVPPDALTFEPDLFVALDTATEERLGPDVVEIRRRAPLTATIDHHVSNTRYGDLVHVDPGAPATGEIVFDLIRAAGLPLTPVVCDQLFAAISTDTGSFRYPSTSAKTLRIAADLVDAGVQPGTLAEALYASFPLRRLELTQAMFATLRVEAGGRIASWVLARADAERIGFVRGDLEGLVDTLRSVASVKVAVQLEEQPDGSIRASVRSKSSGTDVSKICAEFGGGGHRNAAGATLEAPLDEARTKFLAAVAAHLG